MGCIDLAWGLLGRVRWLGLIDNRVERVILQLETSA